MPLPRTPQVIVVRDGGPLCDMPQPAKGADPSPDRQNMLQTFTYPKPEKPLDYETVNPRPLHPLSPPIANSKLSRGLRTLPLEAARRTSGENAARIVPGYILSTHIFQAARPRTKCNIGPTPQFSMSSPTRKQDIAAAGEALEVVREFAKEYRYEEGWPEEPLWIVVNRFVSQKALQRRNSGQKKSSVTLTFTHANGFCKETWEETLKAMVKHRPNFDDTVDEMWLLDAINEADSALVNEGYLGDIFNWTDHARDLQQFLLYYIPERVEARLPIHLTPLSKHTCESRRARGFEHRTLIAVGHSFGGTATVRAAIDIPALFSDVIPVDPVIHCPSLLNAVNENFIPARVTISRKTEWPNRRAALESFKNNTFFQKWDSKALEAYVQYGTVENPATGKARLKTSSYQEAAVFAERRLPSEDWELLPQLDDRVELRWIMNGKDSSVKDHGLPNSVWQREQTVWRREINTSHIRIRDSGHLIPQTKPDDLGKEIASYVIDRYSRNGKIAARL